MARAFAAPLRAPSSRLARHAFDRRHDRRHPVPHSKNGRRRVRRQERADGLLDHRGDRGGDDRQGRVGIRRRRHRRLSRPSLRRRSSPANVRATRARRSQLDPEGAFGTLALGLSQRRNAHPRHGQPLARHPRRELPQGHHPGRHDVLHGRALLDPDPDLHAGRLVHAVAAAAQDAQIDLPIAAGDGRPFGAHHPDFARHARRARLPPGRQGGGARGLGHQSRARIHHARNARSRALQPLDRAPHRIGLCARHLLRRHQRRARRPHARPLHGLHDGGASDLHAAQERGHLADAAPGRHRRREPGVRHHRPRDRLERGARRQAAQARSRRDRVQQRVVRLRAGEVPC